MTIKKQPIKAAFQKTPIPPPPSTSKFCPASGNSDHEKLKNFCESISTTDSNNTEENPSAPKTNTSTNLCLQEYNNIHNLNEYACIAASIELNSSQTPQSNTEALHQSLDTLNTWLFKPHNEILRPEQIKTIIYIPDSEISQIPYAALHDSNGYIVQRYSVITPPGFKIKNHKIRHSEHRALVAGLKIPDGPSIETIKLPLATPPKNMTKSLNENEIRDCKIYFHALCQIDNEVQSITTSLAQNGYKSNIIQDHEFTKQTLQDLTQSGNYSIIHIASHGFFKEDVNTSHILTYDKRLSFKELLDALRSDDVSKSPVDLLTLSACDTDKGSDVALLGLSSISTQTNVLNAIGSLWMVDDAAAILLMTNFYEKLAKENQPIYETLRQAQLSLLNHCNGKFHDPHYWAPFIFVGQW